MYQNVDIWIPRILVKTYYTCTLICDAYSLTICFSLRWYGTPPYYDVLHTKINNKIM